MNKLIYFLIAIAVIIIAIAGGASWFFEKNQPQGIACTMEAKLCPDGSYVSRTGPNCEFTPCPTATSTSENGTGQEGILPYKSGIKGIIMLGPTCPVQRIPPDPKCADKPYQTLVTVFRSSDPAHAIAFTNSDANGMFSLSLPPGDYILGAGESNLPRCDHPQVTVSPDSYTTANISCDTGIR